MLEDQSSELMICRIAADMTHLKFIENEAFEGNVSFHLLRKILGNRALRLNNYSEVSVILLMTLLNHGSPNITKRYLGIREREVMDGYDSLRL